jgi:hypothetical protein
VENIAADQWPKQGGHLGKQVTVVFRYDTSRQFPAVVLRDDNEPPWETILQLEDGRVVRAGECQYSIP